MKDCWENNQKQNILKIIKLDKNIRNSGKLKSMKQSNEIN